MRLAAALAASLLAIPAQAAGGLSCTADDSNVRIGVGSGVTRGMGGPLFDFEGSVEIRPGGVAADLRKVTFVGGHVPQYWLDREHLKLSLYRERAGNRPHGYVHAVIVTRATGDETTYRGRYEVSVFDTTGNGTNKHYSGRITCSAE